MGGAVGKGLMGGDVGLGAMATLDALVEAVKDALEGYVADEAAEAEAETADMELQVVWESGGDALRRPPRGAQ